MTPSMFVMVPCKPVPKQVQDFYSQVNGGTTGGSVGTLASPAKESKEGEEG